MTHPRGLNLYIVIYREMLLKKKIQEPLGQFQPKLAGNIPGGWGIIFVQIKGLNKENFNKSSKNFS